MKIILKGKEKTPFIYARIKYVNEDIPLFVLLRALGQISDKDILECIFYDLGENNIYGESLRDMIEIIRPSLELGEAIKTEEACLAYIGHRALD